VSRDLTHIATTRPRREVETKEDVWEAAVARAKHAIGLADDFTVMFSGGKDSTATLHVVIEAAAQLDRLPVRTIFFDEEAIPIQTEEYVRRIGQLPEVDLEWYCVPFQNRNACSRRSPYWWCWDPGKEDLWVRPLPPEAITELAGFPMDPPEARLAHDESAGLFHPPPKRWMQFMGIRAQESLTRHRAVTGKRDENYIVDYTGTPTAIGNMQKAYPVYDWRTEDVWTAPALFGWDYNRAYDAMEMAGLTHSQQRISPAFGEEPLQKLWTFATCFPEVWPKMTERVPGAAAAGRYALTELWNYGGMIEKPPDMTWEAFIGRYIEKWPDPYRTKIAERVAKEIEKHYRTTADPIVGSAPHPLTGVSWTFLLQVAQRGDFKARKQSGARVNTARIDAYWKRYNDEREAMGLDDET
jgi:predicted phosphoadenosine phosphosulfate sulfurtransferase